jgi:hypothetical protein
MCGLGFEAPITNLRQYPLASNSQHWTSPRRIAKYDRRSSFDYGMMRLTINRLYQGCAKGAGGPELASPALPQISDSRLAFLQRGESGWSSQPSRDVRNAEQI